MSMLLRHIVHDDTDARACSYAVLPSSDVLCFVQAQTDTAVLSAEFACTRDTVLAGTNPTACPASCLRFLNMVSGQPPLAPCIARGMATASLVLTC